MLSFLQILKIRNGPLYYFGWACIIAAAACIVMLLVSNTQVLGINAWIKPFKFFISSAIFVWTMGWILPYLDEEKKAAVYSWMVIIVFAFETIYITLQAAKGQLSHFNISSSFHSVMFSIMGVAIVLMTSWTGYIGYLFFVKHFPALPQHYLWALRFGILFFVVFAFEGGLMAAKLSHTAGAKDGGSGLPLLNWSNRYGDLRVAHFFGMHALQLLPLFSFYVVKNVKATVLVAVIYFIIISFLFMQALGGRPFIKY
jgi:hypothetical protein